jgi:plasmid stability protein
MDDSVRATVTLDADTHQLVRRRMVEHGQPFEDALNDLLRGAAQAPGSVPFQTRTAAMGTPTVDLDRALQRAAELEDDELGRRR